jgi:toxin FitB
VRYLLDTNALSEFLKKAPNDALVRWFGESDETHHFVSTLTIGEIEKGISKLARSRRKDEFSQWLDQVVERYRERLLAIDLEVARTWACLMADLEKRGRPMPIVDSLIAATALQHDLILVTRNGSDFAHTGVKVLSPWK